MGVLITLSLFSGIFFYGSSAILDIFTYGRISHNTYTFYISDDDTALNLLDLDQEVVFGFYDHTKRAYKPLDPRIGTFRAYLVQVVNY